MAELDSSQTCGASPDSAGKYEVQAGDCIASIAFAHGFFWKTVWDDPSNAELRNQRKSPYILLPGDQVTIPQRRLKEESRASEQRHRFKLKGVPVIVRLKILQMPEQPLPSSGDEPQSPPAEPGQQGAEVLVEEPPEQTVDPEPAKNKPFQYSVDGASAKKDQTDDEGKLKLSLKPSARQVRIVIEPGTSRARVIEVHLGELDPIDAASGQAQRLANLDYGVDSSGEDTAGLASALAVFQNDQGLDPTGQADTTTLDKLKEVHGS
jgi:hypothetical protein